MGREVYLLIRAGRSGLWAKRGEPLLISSLAPLARGDPAGAGSDLAMAKGDPTPFQLRRFGFSLVFTADDGYTVRSRGYWMARPGLRVASPLLESRFTPAGDLCYFTTANELWVTGGTQAGTRNVVNPAANPATPSSIFDEAFVRWAVLDPNGGLLGAVSLSRPMQLFVGG